MPQPVELVVRRRERRRMAVAEPADGDAGEAQGLLDAGELEGGIVPKLQAAICAAKLGVRAEIGETAVLA